MCEVLEASKSGYYDWKNRPETAVWLERRAKEEELEQAIIQIFHEHYGTYGSPRIFRVLKDRGFDVCEKTVANRMNTLGLTAMPQKKKVKTTDSDHDKTTYPNHLKRNFQVEALNAGWVADITYVRTLDSWLYLASIMDLCSRKIIAYSIADHMRTELTLSALKKALAIRQPPEDFIHHSDRGSQYCSKEYVDLLKEHHAVISMSRKADPWDNACIESFHATIKKELIYRWSSMTSKAAETEIRAYIDNFYNPVRMHSALGYKSPIQFELLKIQESGMLVS